MGCNNIVLRTSANTIIIFAHYSKRQNKMQAFPPIPNAILNLSVNKTAKAGHSIMFVHMPNVQSKTSYKFGLTKILRTKLY